MDKGNGTEPPREVEAGGRPERGEGGRGWECEGRTPSGGRPSRLGDKLSGRGNGGRARNWGWSGGSSGGRLPRGGAKEGMKLGCWEGEGTRKGQDDPELGVGCSMGGRLTVAAESTAWWSEDVVSMATGAASGCVSLSESISMSPASVISSLLVGSEVAVCCARSKSSIRSFSFFCKDSR